MSAGPQFEKKYRIPPQGAALDDAFFDTRFKDIDLRIFEASLGQIDDATDVLIARGLQQVRDQVQAAVSTLQQGVTNAEAQLATAVASLATLQDVVDRIVNGGNFPASGIMLAPIEGLGASDVQGAMAELLGAVDGHTLAIEQMSDALDTKASTNAVAAALADKQDASPNLTEWAGIGPASKADAAALAGKQNASSTLSEWAGIAPASKANVTAANLKWQGAGYTVSTAAPSGGVDGDFWFQRDA